MVVRQLASEVINRIAAGEVVERPASVVKELVENAIDAGAGSIEIVTAAGGKTLIRVTDDGSGMGPEDLRLAVERHCTSKLDEDNLFAIDTLGFRGEALPSIGAVARLSLTSRTVDADTGWALSVEGGRVDEARPAALTAGTVVDVRDLFFATPARLKFLKSDRAEATAITDVVRRLALAHQHIRFVLTGSDRSRTDYPARTGEDGRAARIADVLGADFIDNALAIEAGREGVGLSGLVGRPTFNRANTQHQFLFVNGRPVRDKLLLGALKGAFSDVMARDRHPVAALFISIDPAEVDVNVHPAKADVRFRDPGLVRGLLVGAIKAELQRAGLSATTTSARAALAAFQREPDRAPAFADAGIGGAPRPADGWYRTQAAPAAGAPAYLRTGAAPVAGFAEEAQSGLAGFDAPSAETRAWARPDADAGLERPLGAARAQIHENYILAQTRDGLVIVDAHAAHERLVYERLKDERARSGVARQMLLVPEIIDLPAEDVARLSAAADDLAETGLVLEAFGPGAIAVREVPAVLADRLDIAGLVRDLVDDLAEWDTTSRLADKLDHLAATIACHGSVRTGRRLKPEEMDALLRDMEATPKAGQCNHGRPTFVELKLADIERLFSRR
ncbi:DNA mismatch repair endonuclease MutL [Amorphus orientalis]|uniref:DNA mismatch repair protein MutL n=1 Tax=Amorphus orientalis TaxID=649198 RepID=A0AAE3VKB3_9HYPH|nr:DNA mismatch repair endonuclease MutL [Amorphus orientalis]MDQ0313959.1 DNA mismatch repair protein MutL [Amorphus orientalis]